MCFLYLGLPRRNVLYVTLINGAYPHTPDRLRHDIQPLPLPPVNREGAFPRSLLAEGDSHRLHFPLRFPAPRTQGRFQNHVAARRLFTARMGLGIKARILGTPSCSTPTQHGRIYRPMAGGWL